MWRPRTRPNYYAAESEPTRITARIVTEFAREVEASGGRFLCLIIPGKMHLL
jgi:hypothetical protein